MKESLYTQLITWVNTILNHIGNCVVLPGYQGHCKAYGPQWYANQNILEYPYPTIIKNL